MSTANPNATVVGLYPAAQLNEVHNLPAPVDGSYLVMKLTGNFSESGIHAGISLVAPLLVALARSNFSAGKMAAVTMLVEQILADVGNKAPLGAYLALVPSIMALVNAS